MKVNEPLPVHYVSALRVLIRYAIVMTLVGLLSGIAFQESSKKLARLDLDPGTRLEATLHLALVHGHILVSAVLLPLGMAGLLLLARKAGGADLSQRATRWLTRGYLPAITASVTLMLYKGYHFLLWVRAGETDMATVRESLFGGVYPLRVAVYGVAHVAMAVSLCAFLWCVWRSLRKPTAEG